MKCLVWYRKKCAMLHIACKFTVTTVVVQLLCCCVNIAHFSLYLTKTI